jgi:hypothetical protein
LKPAPASNDILQRISSGHNQIERAYTESTSISPEFIVLIVGLCLRFLSRPVEPDIVKVHSSRTASLWIILVVETNRNLIDI